MYYGILILTVIFFNDVYGTLGTSQSVSQYYDIAKFNNSFTKERKCILLFNYNIRSFNRNWDLFEGLIGSLSAVPDIVILTET